MNTSTVISGKDYYAECLMLMGSTNKNVVLPRIALPSAALTPRYALARPPARAPPMAYSKMPSFVFLYIGMPITQKLRKYFPNMNNDRDYLNERTSSNKVKI